MSVLTLKEQKLAGAFLSDFAEVLGNRGCNDWEFPDNWTPEERRDFARAYHEWNRDPDEFDPENLDLPDFAVVGFLAAKLHEGGEALARVRESIDRQLSAGFGYGSAHAPGYAAALALVVLVSLTLFAVVSLDAADRDAEEDRTFHAMTVTELAAAKPGSDIPTHVDVAGLVVLAKHERDGDRHLKLCEDESCKAFIVAECIPEFPKPCQRVWVGQWVRVKGISRYDGHHKWQEVHPVESLEVLP